MTIGDNLKKFRNEKKISQRRLAQDAGVSFAYIQQLEKNEKRNPSFEIITKLSIALDININDLIVPTIKGETFINDAGNITHVIPKNNGDISETDALLGIAKYIGYIANSENYVVGEYEKIINSVEDLVRGKILILKNNMGHNI